MRILYIIGAVVSALNLLDLQLGHQVGDSTVATSFLVNILLFVALIIAPNKDDD